LENIATSAAIWLAGIGRVQQAMRRLLITVRGVAIAIFLAGWSGVPSRAADTSFPSEVAGLPVIGVADAV
jgi:hypothetical protein